RSQLKGLRLRPHSRHTVHHHLDRGIRKAFPEEGPHSLADRYAAIAWADEVGEGIPSPAVEVGLHGMEHRNGRNASPGEGSGQLGIRPVQLDDIRLSLLDELREVLIPTERHRDSGSLQCFCCTTYVGRYDLNTDPM